MSRKLAFSLVELVIVVAIIGVVAAIAVPRMSRGAQGADEAALKGSLRILRDAIDMYAVEHGGAWPATDKQEQTFIDQLTRTTDVAGNVGATAGVHIYGPYLQRMPPVTVGPHIGASGVKFKEDGNVAPGGGDADYGWIYNFKTGHIYANSNLTDERGIDYKEY